MKVGIACLGLAVVIVSCGSSRERGSDPRDAGPRGDAGTGDAGRVDAGPAGAFGYCAGEMPGTLDACRTDGDCTDGCSDCYTPGGICGGGCPEPEPECATD